MADVLGLVLTELEVARDVLANGGARLKFEQYRDLAISASQDK